VWEAGSGHSPPDLDNNRLEKDLKGLIFSPNDLLQRCPVSPTLQASVRRCGWPTLDSLKGKFIIVLHGDDEQAARYLTDVNQYQGGPEVGNNEYRGNKVSFVAPDMTTREVISDAKWVNAVFFNVHNTDGLELSKLVYDKGMVSRIWRIDNTFEWLQARANKAHHIATDHVSQERFVPPATHICG
jgi:hypothetical protein